MTLKDYKKIHKILKEVYSELEEEAIESGIDILSEEYDELVTKARQAILDKYGFTEDDYRLIQRRMEGVTKEGTLDIMMKTEKTVEDFSDRVNNLHIPDRDEIEEIAEEVAERVSEEVSNRVAEKVAKKYIVPPKVTNQVVERIIEKRPIKEVVKERVEYDDKPLKKELKTIREKVESFKEVNEVELKEDLKGYLNETLEENINMLGMPNFRKLAMGLQGQIDAIDTSGSGASTFLELTDTPSSYEASKGVRVNSDANALEFYSIVDTDEKVKYDASDPTAGYVADKIVAGTGISVAEGTGANENKLEITSTITQATRDSLGLDTDDTVTFGNLSGTNTGDQTSMSGISDTKANFDTALSDGNFMYSGDAPTAHASSHAVGGADTIFPADPGSDKFLMWDDDPGELVWADIAGGGDVSKVGTPADNQVGVWTGDGTIEGTAGLTYNGSNFLLTGDIGATGTRITKGWFTDLEVTNAIAGSTTGNALPALSNLASVAINTTLVSDTDNTDALGTAAISWSDLYLGNGSVITWTSAPSTADVTLTHSANTLTLAGGDLALGANNITMTGSLAATGSRVTKGWFTDVESTNMPSVGGTPILSSLTAPQFTTIELGHASANTLSASGGVLSIEGVAIPTISSTTTFTNKRITQRVTTTTDDATAVINIDNCDVYELSAIANATEFTTTGTPTDGQKLIIRLKDAGVAKALTWTGFTAIGITLPTTTTAGKWTYVGATYNLAATAWHAIAVSTQA